jgi:tetratricopeptide (TPR) repeat protein
MCHYRWVTGQSAKAFELGKRARSMQEPLKHFPLRVTANYYLGLACLSVGNYSASEKYLRENVDSIQDDQIRERFGVAGFPAAMSRTYLAWALAERGEFDEGITMGRQGVQMADELGHAWSLVTASWGYASVFITKGEAERALELLERALILSREWHLAALTPGVMGSLGYAKALSGKVSDGLPMLDDACKAAEQSGRLALHTLLVVHLGEALVIGERIDEARPVAEQALALSRERGERGIEASALRLLADVISQREATRRENGERHYRNALELADEIGMRPLVARCHFGMGTLHESRRNHQKAREHLTMAVSMLRDLGMHAWCAQAEARLSNI